MKSVIKIESRYFGSPGMKAFLATKSLPIWQELVTRKSFIGPEPWFGISKITRKRVVNEWMTKQHEMAWLNYDGARHTKIFCKAPSKDFREHS